MMLSLTQFMQGVMTKPGIPLQPWTRTDAYAGNKWRGIAKGSRVFVFPIWLYCDDTSGNQSKKWNKHNSFLFTAAGLQQNKVHEEYNVHFLCTSNCAPPLEMMEGIESQLRYVMQLRSHIYH